MAKRTRVRIPGLSFSLSRAVGISAAKGKLARATGIPTTRYGRQRKIGRAATKGFGLLLALPLLGLVAAEERASSKSCEERSNGKRRK